MSTDDIKAKALKVAQRLQVKKVNATSDGNIFRCKEDGNPTPNCVNHAKSNKAKILEFEFTEEELKESETEAKNSSNTEGKKAYGKMTNEELLALITERKIELGTANKKADYVALLDAADAAAEVK